MALVEEDTSWTVSVEGELESVAMERKTLNITEIMSILPHRYPMLLVDRIIELVPGKKSVGLKNVTINEAFFQGHFPGEPYMPGVLILEAMAQAASVLALSEPRFAGMLPILAGLDKAKFRKPVVPGDQLISTAEVMWMRTRIGRVSSTATVDGVVVASVELTFVLTPKASKLADG